MEMISVNSRRFFQTVTFNHATNNVKIKPKFKPSFHTLHIAKQIYNLRETVHKNEMQNSSIRKKNQNFDLLEKFWKLIFMVILNFM